MPEPPEQKPPPPPQGPPAKPPPAAPARQPEPTAPDAQEPGPEELPAQGRIRPNKPLIEDVGDEEGRRQNRPLLAVWALLMAAGLGLLGYLLYEAGRGFFKELPWGELRPPWSRSRRVAPPPPLRRPPAARPQPRGLTPRQAELLRRIAALATRAKPGPAGAKARQELAAACLDYLQLAGTLLGQGHRIKALRGLDLLDRLLGERAAALGLSGKLNLELTDFKAGYIAGRPRWLLVQGRLNNKSNRSLRLVVLRAVVMNQGGRKLRATYGVAGRYLTVKEAKARQAEQAAAFSLRLKPPPPVIAPRAGARFSIVFANPPRGGRSYRVRVFLVRSSD